MSVLSCIKMEVSDAEQLEMRTRRGDGTFERFRIVTDSKDTTAREIAESSVLPRRVNLDEPCPERNAFLKQVELQRFAEFPLAWDALLWWTPADAQV